MHRMEPTAYKIVSPEAAAYIWRISDARLRRLALDGKLKHVSVTGWGKASRAYSFEACRERWGEPDADRLCLLSRFDLFQVTGEGGAVWELYVKRPAVVDSDGKLAVSMER